MRGRVESAVSIDQSASLLPLYDALKDGEVDIMTSCTPCGRLNADKKCNMLHANGSRGILRVCQ
jgi:hypothetical protein